MRRSFYNDLRELSNAERNAAVNVAHLFHEKWRLAATANALSLLPCSNEDDGLIWVLKRLYVGSRFIRLRALGMANICSNRKVRM